jgi:UDP-N-acetyl-D-mannosaminuronate dehydrogenase
MARLIGRGAVVEYADPHVPEIAFEEHSLKAVEVTDERLAEADCVVILTDHQEFDYAQDRRDLGARRGHARATRTIAAPADRVVAL